MTGQKVTVESDGWEVTIEQTDVMNGNAEQLMENIRSAFRAIFGERLEKEYFEDES